jgi:hypothetical protein
VTEKRTKCSSVQGGLLVTHHRLRQGV